MSEERPKCRFCSKPLTKFTLGWSTSIDTVNPPTVGSKYDWLGSELTVLEIVKDNRNYTGWRSITFWLGHWGFQGNGYFCSKTCGYNWALRQM